jgi:galactose oxidase
VVSVTRGGHLRAWPLVAVLSLAAAAGLSGARLTATANGEPGVPAPHPGWTVTADSEETTASRDLATNAIDGDPDTVWQTRYSGGAPAALPHRLTIDTGEVGVWSQLVYLPPQSEEQGGNGRVGRYLVETSLDGTTWVPAAKGSWLDDPDEKRATFRAVRARWVRLTATTEAGGRGPFTSAAEVDLVRGSLPTAPAPGTGRWSDPLNTPVIPAAAAVLGNGEVLLWSSYRGTSYTMNTGVTQTTLLYPPTLSMSHRTVTETQHEMFCPGVAVLPDGRVLVNGGSDDEQTSLYDPVTRRWQKAAPLAVPRGYQSAVTLGDGRVFTLGGSWNDAAGGKNGEVWSPTAGSRLLPGAPVAPILTNDREGVFRSDNHAWLFPWTGNRVFHAGPSRAMGWYGTAGDGSYTPVGSRGADSDAMNGNAVMYAPGKILTLGGSPDYTLSMATANAHVLTIDGPKVRVRKVPSMAHPRAFANSVVLPDGTVLVVGGQQYAKTFSDATSVMVPELWDPSTERFTELAPMAVPRNYHSVAVLLPDGRVLAGGGGLCPSCEANHADVEIFTPPYLLNADGTPRSRPVISSAPTRAAAGSTFVVKANRAVTSFALVRASSDTHSLNTDQRRFPLVAKGSPAKGYSLTLPASRGQLVPGTYLLFALDGKGVPSVARTILVS